VLGLATALCVLATVLLPLAASGHVLAAGIAFLVAQVGYALATNLYDSMVVDVAPPDQRGRVSGLGWAIGLIGGVLAIVVALILMRDVPAPAQFERLGAVFVASGILFAVLAVPAMLGMRGLRATTNSGFGVSEALTESCRKVVTTLSEWRHHRQTLRVLVSFFLINDVLVTIQFFVAIVLSTRFGLSIEGLLKLSLLFHVIAIPSTVLFGTLADRWGHRQTVAAMSIVLAGTVVLLAFVSQPWTPGVSAVLLGLVFGSLQAVFRALYASLVAADSAAELFGFNTLAGRVSAAIGPLVFGAAAAIFGSNTWALCLLLIPLAAGVALLLVPARPTTAGATRMATRA